MARQDSSTQTQPRPALYSAEAEEAVLGAILLNPEVFHDVSDFLSTEDFFIVRHGWIWEAIRRLHERREAVDYLTVVEELRNMGHLEEAGGQSYITHLIDNTPTSIHAETYGRIVERMATRRRLLDAASQIASHAHNEELDVDEAINRSERALFQAIEHRQKRDTQPIQEVIEEYLDQLTSRYEGRDRPMGIPTGFRELDKLLGGMQKGDLIIIAGRPGMGKTSWLISTALNAARRFQSRVVIFSLEMSNEQVVQRMISAETGIDSRKLRSGDLNEEEWRRLTYALDSLSKLQIFLDDTPSLSAIQMRTKCRRLHAEYGLDLIMVDYLQLMASGVRAENRVQEISYISRSLKQLARELRVPVLSAAQLSRAVEQRQDKRPQLSDLRESGSIEQDADMVLFIYRDEAYNEDTDRPNQADIIVAKHRNGPTGTVTLFFRKEQTLFTDPKVVSIDLGSE